MTVLFQKGKPLFVLADMLLLADDDMWLLGALAEKDFMCDNPIKSKGEFQPNS